MNLHHLPHEDTEEGKALLEQCRSRLLNRRRHRRVKRFLMWFLLTTATLLIMWAYLK